MRSVQTFVVSTLLVVLGASSSAEAQSAEERRAAGNAYNRGSTAYLAENWAQAARWFETAHRLAPAAPALVQAVRAHKLAGNDLRAATLALRLNALYADNADASSTASEVLGEQQPRFLRVDVVCEGCSVELDGTLQEFPSFFVTPGEEHTVTASFETGEVEDTVRGRAGAQRELSFDAPPPPPEGVTPPVEEDPRDDPDDGRVAPAEPEDEGGGGLSPLFFISSAALTVGAGAVLVWSGLDALGGVEDYESDPTPEALAEGQNKELRTNIMIGVTAGLGAVTVLLLLFTDWDGDDEENVDVAVAPLEEGAAAFVGGRF